MSDTVEQRLERVRARVAEAARAAGREPRAVRLVAVSKRKPAELIERAYAAGQRDFGENYSQELVAKAAALEHLRELRWHHIGRVQTNKVRLLLAAKQRASLGERLMLLHSIDRAKLMDEIERRAAAADLSVRVLIQVNVSGEASKGGCAPAALGALIEHAERCPHVLVAGLMTMPPLGREPDEARPHFRALAALREAHGGSQRLPELSMGMSQDFELAIAAGATLVRVGTAIFGARRPDQG